MTGNLNIDGMNIFTKFGVFITKSGYNDIVSYPSLKKIDANDWPDEDGIDPDLSEPVLDSKNVQIHFGVLEAANMNDFLVMLSDMSYHDFEFTDLGITRRLRLNTQPSFRSISDLGVFSLQFADDFPLYGYEYEEPASIESVCQRGFVMDDRDLSDYGISLLGHVGDELMRSPDIKANLTAKTDSFPGTVYDDSSVVFKEKDVTLNCFLRAPDITTFWRNYNAFLFDLTRSGERILYVRDTDEIYGFSYKSSKVTSFALTDKEAVWCEFSLTLTFNYRPGQIEYLLAAEDDSLFVTEDSDNHQSTYFEVKRI